MAKKNTKQKSTENKSNLRRQNFQSQINFWQLGGILLSLFFGYTHYKYAFNLFENERHFSHLATIERDMSFRTEMGLYYSYYKTLIHADTWKAGIHEILNDEITEYPSKINVLKRFNLWPEVFIGTWYRILVKDLWESKFKIRTKECWMVNRGQGKSQVHSCEGWGDEHYFYVYPIFMLHGFVLVGSLCFLGIVLSESYLGGILTVAMYYFNHGEATRVMWTPPLRESWSFPFLPWQMLAVCLILKNHPKSQKYETQKFSFRLIFSSLLFMIFWQFAQFALLTQTCCVMIVYLLDLTSFAKFNCILLSQFVALLANYILQFGNEMLLSSFYFSCVIIAYCIGHVNQKITPKIGHIPKLARLIIFIPMWFLATFQLKNFIATAFQIEDDKHIFDILKSKFTDFDTFDTKLYTCAKEFDFLEVETVFKLTKTGLLPLVFVVLVVVAWQSIKQSLRKIADQPKPASATNLASASDLNINLYMTLQMLAFTVLAILIMRLKLFMTPTMCILVSILVNAKFLNLTPRNVKLGSVLVIILGFYFAGSQNMKFELAKRGNFENLPQEEMFEWIIKKIPKDKGVFAGAMPTMANLKHITGRAIVNHPHYENKDIRERTFKVYSMWSRRPINKIHQTLKEMQVTHFVYESNWCHRTGGSNNCSMPQLFDLMEPEYKMNKPTCKQFTSNEAMLDGYFDIVFDNGNYMILKIL